MAAPGARKLQHADSFQDLEVYKKSRLLAREIFALTQKLPADERFALADQIRRSSGSVGAQIAESWAKRRYPKHFVAKLTDADGEQLETQHWLNVVGDRGYLEPTDLETVRDLCVQIGRMLGSMSRKADSFSGNLKENPTDYTTDH